MTNRNQGGDKNQEASEQKALSLRKHVPLSLSARMLLGASLWMVVVLVAGGIMLSILFRETLERNLDTRLSLLLDNLIGVSNVAEEGIVSLYRAMGDPRFDRPYSGWYWQISEGENQPFRSRSLWDQALDTDMTRTYPRSHLFNTTGPEGQHLRAVERDIILPDSNRVFRFIIAADKSGVYDDVRQFNQTLFIWLAVLGLGLIAAMVILVRYGLQPLRRIRRMLSDIRSGRASRLDDDFPAEVMPLVIEMNALLQHNETVVERAKTHVGNLAHSLKTPLTVISNEAGAEPDLPLSRIVLRHTAAMSRNIDHHLARARAAARGSVIGARTPVTPVINDMRRALQRIYKERRLVLGVHGPDAGDGEGPAFRGERQDLDEMLGNLMDNACKWAYSQVQISVAVREDKLVLIIEDDGPGIAENAREQVFGRGERADETVPGTGLGLSIVRDIAELCGGTVKLSESHLGGVRAKLILPSADM